MSYYKKKSETELWDGGNRVVRPKLFWITGKDRMKVTEETHDGWKWFDTRDEALAYFKVTEPLWTNERVKMLEKLDFNAKKALLNTNIKKETIDTALSPGISNG